MDEREFLRHLLATLAYRGGKCLRGAPPAFATFPGGGRTPLAILSHISDLLERTHALVLGEELRQEAVPEAWDLESARFFAAMERLDGRLAAGPLGTDWQRLVHGPLADALTHVGQLAMLRRMAGCPLPRESYSAAEITTGRVGADQAPARKPYPA
ncbi:hypothetical protein [Mesoterricola silvestris]|uniref:Uncharacterized protein n=1 Tax=Mesoterricola silvestris TaxID=2927979 RepID=A0AA48K8N0_9BACT|nr:hypothetical protein [Mesoterricola silvestris]BDU72290.1 hypothetical protein METEAL_14640 [Mesoterricola silvestris]